jgi:hypothetical protein
MWTAPLAYGWQAGAFGRLALSLQILAAGWAPPSPGLHLLPDALDLPGSSALVHHLHHPLYHPSGAGGVAGGAPIDCATLLLLQLVLQLGNLLLQAPSCGGRGGERCRGGGRF